MTKQASSKEGRSVSEATVQQDILRQAQAAASAQTDAATPTRRKARLQKADLITPDLAEGDVPPPTYGEVYGEIKDEKNGLGTSARVTDDGRVNIRINQVNRHLSQIFAPALHQQVKSVQNTRVPPPPYIPPSLGGDGDTPPPPSLNVVIQVVGSRGDVQPFVALGKVLKNTYGHRVRLATHPVFKDFVQENGLEFFSIGADPARLMAFMVKNTSLMRSLWSGDVGQQRRDVAEYIQGCWWSCYQAGDRMDLHAANDNLSEFSESDTDPEHAPRPFIADCIIANPPSFAHIHCAERLGIPLHIMFTMPYSPTQAFPHPLANIQSSNADPQLTNYMSYAMIEILSWQGLGDIINRFRAKCLGLEPVSQIWAPGMLHRLKIPHTYFWSPALIPKPKDWGSHISISGFCFLDLASNYTPKPELEAFLKAGPPPVYIGFGSIVLEDLNAMTELIFEAVRKTGQRVLLSKGWGGIGAEELHIPNNIFLLGNVPHDWLFKHVSCVVHHGGAGTTAAGILAGRPTLVVPFFGDQPFWGAMVAKAGAGPNPIPHKKLTADNLADAINFCLRPESLERAKELAAKITEERGSDTGAQSFHQYLEADRLRCTLAPSRSAVWRIKRTKIRLSAFAACTLANANLLDFHDLKLFRPQEHNTDEGPWDPISGGAAQLFGSMSDMTRGLADIPTETWKAVQMPMRFSQQQSHERVPASAGRNESSHIGENSSNLAYLSSPPSDTRLSPMPNTPEGQPSPKQNTASHNQVRSRNESSSGKDQDRMRHTGAHMSKGLGRIVKATVQAPMDFSMSLTKGFNNVPKLWGDDTVRRPEPVSDFKSGAKAMGKGFGLGFYDGVTGLVTQPWRGARKEGAGGFFKGLGKGVGGFVAKPGAALFGIPAYMMKGVHKEVQKLFGSNVQSYIISSRTAQGYEEWLESSEVEKEDVIARWKLIQKYAKGKHEPEEMMRDILKAHPNTNMEDREGRQESIRTADSAQLPGLDALALDPEKIVLHMEGSESSTESLEASEINETIGSSAYEISAGDAQEDDIQHQRQEAVDYQADQEDLRQAILASQAEAQRHANDALEYEKQLKQVIAQSLREQEGKGDDGEFKR